MSSTLILVVAGCLLGIVQVAAGVAIGMWLRRPTAASRDADLRRARSLALDLHGLTQRIGGHVAAHRTRFELAEAKLTEVPAGRRHPTTDLVVGVVGEILQANRQLQAELMESENLVAEQARQIESQLSTLLTDKLTSLPNRRALDDQLADRLKDYRTLGTPFSLLMVDVDYFKQINDTFGHPVGDEVLAAMGHALRAALRRHDFVARYGGEEFAIIFPHTSLDEARQAAGKACGGVATLTDEFPELGRTITASGGLASIEPGEEIESLLRRADDALYAAKRNGRDCIYLHDGTEYRQLVLGDSAECDRTSPSEQVVGTSDEVERRPSAALVEACDELRDMLVGTK